MVELYLPETDERQFLIWLHTYCGQKIASNTVYKFSDGWSYKLYYPLLATKRVLALLPEFIGSFAGLERRRQRRQWPIILRP